MRPRGTRVVFATEAGGAHSKNGFRSIWLPALLAAGLAHEEARDGRTLVVADFRFHWLRHIAISLMGRAGMKAELIVERVGHNDGGALVYRRYRHLFRSEVRELYRCSTGWSLKRRRTPRSGATEWSIGGQLGCHACAKPHG